ncbi:hypothetical protein BV372_16195 [Nostoc sp. T09]|nr:hypothetical protein BV372_16195 [Nostoc sp. T09]
MFYNLIPIQIIDFLQKSVKGKGEKGKGTQNPFPLTFSLSPLLQKYIFARGLMFATDKFFVGNIHNLLVYQIILLVPCPYSCVAFFFQNGMSIGRRSPKIFLDIFSGYSNAESALIESQKA